MKSYLLPVEDLVVVYANDEEFLKTLPKDIKY